MEKLYTKIVSLAVLLVGLSGCETICDAVGDLFREQKPVDKDVVATWWDGPRVRPGVGLIIQVGPISSPPTRVECLVDQKGEITMPLLLQKPVPVDGLTLEELKAKLVEEYSVYYRQPQVTVTFAPFDGNSGVSPWGTVTVLGEVGRPGPVNLPATMDMTVTKMLQAAGGLSTYADRTRIRVSRCDRDGNQTRYYVNLNEIGKDGRPDLDMSLRAGDVIWVPTTWY